MGVTIYEPEIITEQLSEMISTIAKIRKSTFCYS